MVSSETSTLSLSALVGLMWKYGGGSSEIIADLVIINNTLTAENYFEEILELQD